jgi:neurobeachin-like protein 1/2
LSHHENIARMRFKLEPSLYHDPHTAAANLRDNTTTTSNDQKLSAELGSSLATAALGDENQDEDSIMIEEEIRNSIESQM